MQAQSMHYWYYTFAYSVASIAAFASIHFVTGGKEETLDTLKGLMYKHPFIGVSLLIALLSMAGIPVTAGFFAKYYVLNALLMSSYKWMIIAAILASILGVVYYLRIALKLFEVDKKQDNGIIALSTREVFLLGLSVLLLIVVGIYPDIIANTFLK